MSTKFVEENFRQNVVIFDKVQRTKAINNIAKKERKKKSQNFSVFLQDFTKFLFQKGKSIPPPFSVSRYLAVKKTKLDKNTEKNMLFRLLKTSRDDDSSHLSYFKDLSLIWISANLTNYVCKNVLRDPAY